MDSELDRTYNPYARNEEFEAWLDSREDDERQYEKWVQEQERKLDLRREEGKRF
jgi:hypothetical protein